MKSRIILASLLAVSMLVACNDESVKEEDTKTSAENITEQDTNATVETENIKELVQDYSEHKIEAESASVTPEQLIVTDKDDKESVYQLPKDEFFVSIAPYINETHPCTNHSLTGCQAELINEEFKVYVEDAEGNVVLDETVTSQANGFFDLWLKRNQTYQIKIEHKGKTAESEISTFENDKTCISTMQLT